MPGGALGSSDCLIVGGAVAAAEAAIGARDATRGSSPPTINLQPRPLRAWVSYKRVAGQVVTAIFRQWRPGESSRCRLCPAGKCTAQCDGCIVQVVGVVPAQSAGVFSSIGRRWDDDGAGLGIFN